MIFTTMPKGFSAKIEVVGCYCEYGEKILLLLRNSEKPQGNTWCIPGGKRKTEEGESVYDALYREVYEETGVVINHFFVLPVMTLFVRSEELDFVYYLFRCVLPDDNVHIRAEEHNAYRWVTPQEALTVPLIEDEAECLSLAYRL